MLKNTTKKTSEMTITTLESSPRPNQRMKSGASTTRGMAFSATMSGSKMWASICQRAKVKPTATPSRVPSRNPMMVSCIVTNRCRRMNPVRIQSKICAASTVG